MTTGLLVLVLVGPGGPGAAGAVQPRSAPPTIDPASLLAEAVSPTPSPPNASPSSRPVASAIPTPPGGATTGSVDGAGSSPDDQSAAASWSSPGLPPGLAAQLQARLAAILAKYKLPGVSATIIWPDGRMWTGASGWADVAHKIPVVSGTAFSVGSVSKTFLAALVLELVREGRLSLDDTVRHWLPSAIHVSTKVTVRELLNHTSGLYDFFENTKIDPALLDHRSAVWTPDRALSYMKAAVCNPGTCWAYSNSNFVLLGEIVERVTGQTTTALLRQRFFDPLGLSRTFVQGVEARKGTVATSYKLTGTPATRRMVSLADGTGITPFTSVVTAAGAAGDIASSSVDLAKWARALYTGGVLVPQSLAQMEDTTASVRLHAPTPYGFAFSAISLGGRLTYGHNGRLLGARASIRYLPLSGFTVAVVTNQDIVGPDVFGTALVGMAIAATTRIVPTGPAAGSTGAGSSAPPSAMPIPPLKGSSPGPTSRPTATPSLGPPPELQYLLPTPSPGP